jgi:hypothetical protein
MAHFAKLGANGKVIQVLTLDNKDMLNADGVEDEAVGQQYLELHNNWPAQMWIQTSYNTAGGQHKNGGTPFRGNYAGIGYTWDEDNQIFWPKKPYASWVKHIATASWKSPIGDAPALTAEQTSQNKLILIYGLQWNEETTAWDLTNSLSIIYIWWWYAKESFNRASFIHW